MKRSFLLLIALVLLMPMAAFAQEESREVTFHISSYQQECMGLAPRNCLLVRPIPDGEFGFMFDEIEGFEFEEGYEYIVRLSVTEIENPPQDASSLQYDLIEIERQLPASISDKLWILQSFGDYDSVDINKFSLIFNEDGTVAITSDCNAIMLSEYTLNPANVNVAGSTMMFCEFSLENPFLNGLGNIRFLAIENGELYLQTEEGLMHFSAANIDGINWRLSSYDSEDLSWEDDGTVDYTLLLEEDSASLQIACNGGSGTVEREGSILRFDAVVSTLMGCMSEPLAGIFPPSEAVYSVNAEGQLILETANGETFTFTASE